MTLCGHGTLAGAYVIFNFIDSNHDYISFQSNTEKIVVKKAEKGRLKLNFPAIFIEEIDAFPKLTSAIGSKPKSVYRSSLDYLVVLDYEEQVSTMNPDPAAMLELDLRGVIVTSQSQTDQQCDFVSRYFASEPGVPQEDQVTGSAHCLLVPYWAKKLSKPFLRAKQISSRGGELFCEFRNDRVYISGHAVLYKKGMITL